MTRLRTTTSAGRPRTSRVDSFQGAGPPVASCPAAPDRLEARPGLGRTTALTREGSALTCRDAIPWTHACLPTIRRFRSSMAQFRVQADNQVRNPGWSVQVLEQMESNILIRPLTLYNGPAPRAYTPMDGR